MPVRSVAIVRPRARCAPCSARETGRFHGRSRQVTADARALRGEETTFAYAFGRSAYIRVASTCSAGQRGQRTFDSTGERRAGRCVIHFRGATGASPTSLSLSIVSAGATSARGGPPELQQPQRTEARGRVLAAIAVHELLDGCLPVTEAIYSTGNSAHLGYVEVLLRF